MDENVKAVRDALAGYTSMAGKLPDMRVDQLNRFVMEIGAENPSR